MNGIDTYEKHIPRSIMCKTPTHAFFLL